MRIGSTEGRLEHSCYCSGYHAGIFRRLIECVEDLHVVGMLQRVWPAFRSKVAPKHVHFE